MKKKWYVIAPVGIVAFLAAGGLIVESLWNWLLPLLFGWHTVTFWQALGSLALCRILFGGWGGHGGRGRHGRMTPEERDRLRENMRTRCGKTPEAGAPA